MLVSIELPERLVDALENRARKIHSSLQEHSFDAGMRRWAALQLELLGR
jgi:hypothetical protein